MTLRPHPLETSRGGILERMIYIRRMRRLVRIVYDETNSLGGSIIDPKDRSPTIDFCLSRFEALNKRYTPEVARTTLAMAIKRDYLEPRDSRSQGNMQRLVVTGEGLILLTRTDYINELAGSIGKVSSTGSWIVSLLALTVSIWVATRVK